MKTQGLREQFKVQGGCALPREFEGRAGPSKTPALATNTRVPIKRNAPEDDLLLRGEMLFRLFSLTRFCRAGGSSD